MLRTDNLLNEHDGSINGLPVDGDSPPGSKIKNRLNYHQESRNLMNWILLLCFNNQKPWKMLENIRRGLYLIKIYGWVGGFSDFRSAHLRHSSDRVLPPTRGPLSLRMVIRKVVALQSRLIFQFDTMCTSKVTGALKTWDSYTFFISNSIFQLSHKLIRKVLKMRVYSCQMF